MLAYDLSIAAAGSALPYWYFTAWDEETTQNRMIFDPTPSAAAGGAPSSPPPPGQSR
jgi:hypothetical protein